MAITGRETKIAIVRVGVHSTVPGAVTQGVAVTRTRRVRGASDRAGRATNRAGRAGHRTASLRSRDHLRCGGLLTLSVLQPSCVLPLQPPSCVRLSCGSLRSFTVGMNLLNRACRIHNAGTTRGLVALNTLRGGL